MTLNQHNILRKLREARQVIREADQTEASLVKDLFDIQLRMFAQIDPDMWTDAEYAAQWERERNKVARFLNSEGFIPTDRFNALWDAFDTLATEEAMAYA